MAEKQLSTARNLLFLITLVTLLLLPASATTTINADVLRYVILLQNLPDSVNVSSTLPRNLHFPTLNRDSSLTINELSPTNYFISENSLFGAVSFPSFAIDDFFFNVSSLPQESLCTDANPFADVSEFLDSNGFSFLATFLDAELSNSKEFRNGAKFTIFAPLDSSFPNVLVMNITAYSEIFRKHVVPRLITWRDLTRLPEHTLLPTLFSNGFSIRVTSSWRVRFVNGVMVVVPDMYLSDLVVVHGIHSLLDNSIM
ncbi:hypothetical protein PIB30_048008 [Stylosanthes scabra]|uniref:FAS1 domain-containing protein n=1 Tax=Stylosanthes scabra TaxID=79078 RepID=A0ABU6VIG7_9FABA|nr:hypothetical protein [Stylosanthes scabra]